MFKASGAVQRLILCCAACVSFSVTAAAETKSSEVIDFAAIKPGSKVAHFLPADVSHIKALCNTVGDTGRVYAVSVPLAVESESGTIIESSSGCQNITAITLRSRNYPAPELYDAGGNPGAVYEYNASRLPVESFVAPEPLDLILIVDRYRDLRGTTYGAVNMTYLNTALFKALKPGGVLIVAEPHRLNIQSITTETCSIGFKFIDKSSQAIDGVNRVLLKFRKPE